MILRFAIEWSFLVLLWMLLAAKWSVPELLVGGIASILAQSASLAVRKYPSADFAFSFSAFAQAWRLPGYVLVGSWALLRALLRELFTREGAESLLCATKFEVGRNDAHSRTRRALGVIYTCGTPDTVVLGIDLKNQLLLYHRFKAGKVLRMTKKLGTAP